MAKGRTSRKFKAENCLYVWKGYGEIHLVDACERTWHILAEKSKKEPLPISKDTNAWDWMTSFYVDNNYKRMRLFEDAEEFQTHSDKGIL